MGVSGCAGYSVIHVWVVEWFLYRALQIIQIVLEHGVKCGTYQRVGDVLNRLYRGLNNVENCPQFTSRRVVYICGFSELLPSSNRPQTRTLLVWRLHTKDRSGKSDVWDWSVMSICFRVSCDHVTKTWQRCSVTCLIITYFENILLDSLSQQHWLPIFISLHPLTSEFMHCPATATHYRVDLEHTKHNPQLNTTL